MIGYITVTKIVNPILDKEEEKWILFDGREIHTPDEFYRWVQEHMTNGFDCKIGQNGNAFNDILWGGLGVHEYGETLHIVWIYAEESRQCLGDEFFNSIVAMIENHESGNKYLELYKEHAFE